MIQHEDKPLLLMLKCGWMSKGPYANAYTDAFSMPISLYARLYMIIAHYVCKRVRRYFWVRNELWVDVCLCELERERERTRASLYDEKY